MFYRIFVATLVTALLISGSPVSAGLQYWDNNGTTVGFGTAGGTWGTDAFWNSDSTGGAGTFTAASTTADDMYFGFDANGLATGTINVAGTVDAANLFFGKTSGNLTLSGGTINLGAAGNAGIRAESSGGSTTAQVTIDSNLQKTNGGNIAFGRQNTTNENYIVNGVISGNAGLDLRPVNNGAYVALNGVNTFSGTVGLVTGQLNVNTVADSGIASSLGTGSTINIAGGGGQNPTLWYTGVADGSTNRTINLNGGSTRFVSQDAQLSLSGNVTGTSAGFQSQLFLSGDAGGGSNFNEISGVIGGNLRLVVGSFAPIDGIAEEGRWRISGDNTYTGTTTISSGVLQADHANALGTGNIIFTGGELQYTSNSSGADYSSRIVNSTSAVILDTNGQDVTFGTALATSNTGGLTKNGAGVLEIKMGTSYSGDTNVNAGTLRVANVSDLAGTSSSNYFINNGSTLEFESSIGGNNRTVLNNKTFTFDSNGGGTINFDGGNHLFQGGSTHNFVTTGGATNTISATSGGFMNMQGAGNVVFDVADGTDAVDLELSASFNNGQITKNGTGTMSITTSTGASFGNNDIAINAGTLDVGGSAALGGGTFAGAISNTGTLSYTSTANQTLSGVISGTGSVIQNSTGTLTLSADNTYTGTTTVSSGTLVVNGDHSAATGDVTIASTAMLAGTGTIGGATTISGTHAPGVDNIAAQTFASDLTYAANSVVHWELEDNTAAGRGTDFDGINVGGDLNFTGATTVDLDFLTGVDFGDTFWDTDQEWNIWNVTGTTSGFGDLSVGSISNDSLAASSGGSFVLFQDGNNVNLRFIAAVPEPSSIALLGLGLLGCALRRRRRTSIRMLS